MLCLTPARACIPALRMPSRGPSRVKTTTGLPASNREYASQSRRPEGVEPEAPRRWRPSRLRMRALVMQAARRSRILSIGSLVPEHSQHDEWHGKPQEGGGPSSQRLDDADEEEDRNRDACGRPREPECAG